MTALIGWRSKDWTLLVADRRLYMGDYYIEETKIFDQQHWVYGIAGAAVITDPVLLAGDIEEGYRGLLEVSEKLTELTRKSKMLGSEETGQFMLIEKATGELWYATGGCLPWQMQAVDTVGKYQDELLFLLKRCYDTQATVRAALWAIRYAVEEVIRRSPVYLGFPLDYAVVSKGKIKRGKVGESKISVG
ncbi:hypothetical protein HYZ97_01020 [Candidatus Pacearchaeota archaeon]|nr:hypothetical protein [Candidatus Pacearchaeota archaeon]